MVYYPPVAQITNSRVAIPVQVDYVIDLVNPQTITDVDIHALVTSNPTDLLETLELGLQLDEANVSTCTVAFTDGSTFDLLPGTEIASFDVVGFQPSTLTNFTITLPVGCGCRVIAMVGKTEQ